MTNILINLIIINLILVYTIDVLDIPNNIYRFIIRIITRPAKTLSMNNVTAPKPFSCSFCMIFWISIALLGTYFGVSDILYIIGIALISAHSQKWTLTLILAIDQWISWITNKLIK